MSPLLPEDSIVPVDLGSHCAFAELSTDCMCQRPTFCPYMVPATLHSIYSHKKKNQGLKFVADIISI